ncbi:MAG: hypothetical protein ACR2P6_03775 [Gammaproteobacteria bacterium]
MIRALLCLFAAFLATIAAANLAYNINNPSLHDAAHDPWVQNRMEFVAWNNEQWTAWIRGEQFEQLPQNDRKWNRHANASLAFTDWNGDMWQAKISGDEFILAHRGDWNGPTESAAAIRYRDWQGNNQLRTVAQLRR